jgi:hypothetical protein
LLNSTDQDLTLDHLRFRNQSALEEAEKPEPEEKTTTVRVLTEGLEVIKAGIKVSEDTDSSKERAATTKQGIRRLPVCYEEILKEKKRSLSLQTSVF